MISFCDFIKRLGMKEQLSIGQRVLCSVSFDGLNPSDLVLGEERDIAAEIYGENVTTIPDVARAIVAWILGARSGKSWIAAHRGLHAALTCDLSSLAPGERGAVILVAPDLRLSRQTIRYAQGAARTRNELAQMVFSETSDSLTIKRENKLIEITSLPASRAGTSVRGRTVLFCALDESCFFRAAADGYEVSDGAIFDAIAPRVRPGSQIMVCSTPWGSEGLLWKLREDNWNHPTSAICAHASTMTLRGDDPAIRAMIRREELRDPRNAAREFGAVFGVAASGSIFSDELIAKVSTHAPPQLPPEPEKKCWAGVDLGFSRDSSALIILRETEDRIGLEICEIMEWKSKAGRELKPSEVIRAIAALCDKHGARILGLDSHALSFVREHLEGTSIRIVEVPTTNRGKADMFARLQSAFTEGILTLPDHTRLKRQLTEVVIRPGQSGVARITSPRRGGSHGDLVSALIAAIWAARGHNGGDAYQKFVISKLKRGSDRVWTAPENEIDDFEVQGAQVVKKQRKAQTIRAQFGRGGY